MEAKEVAEEQAAVADTMAEPVRAAMLVEEAGFVAVALGTEAPPDAEVEKVAEKSETFEM